MRLVRVRGLSKASRATGRRCSGNVGRSPAGAASRGTPLSRRCANPASDPASSGGVVRGRGGPAPRQDREVGVGNQQHLAKDPGERQPRRGRGRALARTGGRDLAEQEARGP